MAVATDARYVVEQLEDGSFAMVDTLKDVIVGSAGTEIAAGTSAQIHNALAGANRTRLARAELKRMIREGSVMVVDVVRDVPWEAATMPALELLMAQHRWGRTRSRRFLASIPLLEMKHLGAMTNRQRAALIEGLEPSMEADDGLALASVPMLRDALARTAARIDAIHAGAPAGVNALEICERLHARIVAEIADRARLDEAA